MTNLRDQLTNMDSAASDRFPTVKLTDFSTEIAAFDRAVCSSGRNCSKDTEKSCFGRVCGTLVEMGLNSDIYTYYYYYNIVIVA